MREGGREGGSKGGREGGRDVCAYAMGSYAYILQVCKLRIPFLFLFPFSVPLPLPPPSLSLASKSAVCSLQCTGSASKRLRPNLTDEVSRKGRNVPLLHT